MNIFVVGRRALLIGLIFLIAGAQVYADDQFYSLSDLKPGMTGEGYTVFSGTEVEAFPIEVVGLLEGTGTVAHLILIKITGNNAWGVAAGMSGSPIFINKKLVGAIGYGFQNADSRYAMVTPIEEMLALWDNTINNGEKFGFYQGSLPGFKGVAFDREPPGDSWLWAQPVLSPLFISGFGPRACDCIRSTFEGVGLLPSLDYSPTMPTLYPLALASKDQKKNISGEMLKPGSAITVSLVEGDYQVAALGTLTWIKNGKFLGLGHPFLNKGHVEYGVGGAEIVRIIDSNIFPFKLGIAFPSIGRVLQDRGAGIGGEIGYLPRMVKVRTKVTDESSHVMREYEFVVVNEESLFPGLALAGIVDAIDQTIDRIGEGTAIVKFQINGNNFPAVQRENLFFGRDIAAAAVKEVGRFLQLIAENEFVQPQITEILTEIKVNPERLSAKLTKVELPKKEFIPGEKVTLNAKILPYRGKEDEIPLEIEIPATPGKWLLLVYGSDYGFVTEENQEETKEENFEAENYKTYSSLDQVLKQQLKKPQNNQLVAEFLPVERMEEMAAEMEDDDGKEEVTNEQKSYWTATTSYYLTGEEQILIEVAEPVPEKKEPDFNQRQMEEYKLVFLGTNTWN